MLFILRWERIENLALQGWEEVRSRLNILCALSTPFYNLPYLGQRGEAA
jgi:hypothetical protein